MATIVAGTPMPGASGSKLADLVTLTSLLDGHPDD